MAREIPVIPVDTVMLCEGCGYALTGLPDDARCPECGKPMVESVGENPRKLSEWETQKGWKLFGGFMSTTFSVLFRPTQFFLTLSSRADPHPAGVFAAIHWMIASIFFGWAVWTHVLWLESQRSGRPLHSYGGYIIAAIAVFFLLWMTTRIAASLSAWEAAYRGMRLPLNVVRRGLYFHAAHYLPVSLMVFATIVGNQWLLRYDIVKPESATTYLYILSGEVIVAAGYLFNTYWIGMSNMRYANR